MTKMSLSLDAIVREPSDPNKALDRLYSGFPNGNLLPKEPKGWRLKYLPSLLCCKMILSWELGQP